MGLDMYLTGKKSFSRWKDTKNGEPNPPMTDQDGDPIEESSVELGYWRKHPNLHGYIVKAFADGVDECQPIILAEADLVNIIDRVNHDALPETSGFFFGKTDGSEKAGDIVILQKAIEWMKTDKTGQYRSVVYQASW